MHVVVSKKDLLRVLGRCQGVADKKSTMPVLGNVLLEVASPNELGSPRPIVRFRQRQDPRRRSKTAARLRSARVSCSTACA